MIKERAFGVFLQLTTVCLREGLEMIGMQAFMECTSLGALVIPSGIRVITKMVFSDCSQLTTVNFTCKGLEENMHITFGRCTLLQCKVIPPAVVTAIKYGAFYRCTPLATVILGNGLEEIGDMTFSECT